MVEIRQSTLQHPGISTWTLISSYTQVSARWVILGRGFGCALSCMTDSGDEGLPWAPLNEVVLPMHLILIKAHESTQSSCTPKVEDLDEIEEVPRILLLISK